MTRTKQQKFQRPHDKSSIDKASLLSVINHPYYEVKFCDNDLIILEPPKAW